MKPKLDEERKRIVDAAREEALENAIALVKQKIREQIELEQQAKEETCECLIIFSKQFLFLVYLFLQNQRDRY